MPLGPGRRREALVAFFAAAERVLRDFERVLSFVAILLPPNHWVVSLGLIIGLACSLRLDGSVFSACRRDAAKEDLAAGRWRRSPYGAVYKGSWVDAWMSSRVSPSGRRGPPTGLDIHIGRILPKRRP